MPDETEEAPPVKHITAPLPPIVPPPTEEDRELKAAQADLHSAQKHLDRLAYLAAQAKLITRARGVHP